MSMKVLNFKDIDIGREEVTKRKVTEEDVNIFGKLSGDLNPLHMDEQFASKTPFRRRVVHGMFTASIVSTTHTNLTGPGYVYVGQELNFKAPLYIGDTVMVSVAVVEKKIDKGILILETTVVDQDGKLILDGRSALKELVKLTSF